MDPCWTPEPRSSWTEEHTADLWIVGRGTDPASTVASMMVTLYSVIASEFLLSDEEPMSYGIVAGSPEEALVRTLAEALYLLEAEGRILPEPSVSMELSEGTYHVTVRGRSFRFTIPDPKRGLEVKAITYHGASLERKMEGGPYQGRVLIDI